MKAAAFTLNPCHGVDFEGYSAYVKAVFRNSFDYVIVEFTTDYENRLGVAEDKEAYNIQIIDNHGFIVCKFYKTIGPYKMLEIFQ